MALISKLGDRHEKLVLDNFNSEQSIYPRVWLNRNFPKFSKHSRRLKEDKILATLEAGKEEMKLFIKQIWKMKTLRQGRFPVKNKESLNLHYFYEALDAKLARNGNWNTSSNFSFIQSY